jgi:hypothetical protein
MVRDIVVNGDTAYFGGSFLKHNGIAQMSLGAVKVVPGQRATGVPAFNATTDGVVYGLALTGSRLIVGGKFTMVNGAARAQLASVNLGTNALEGWRPASACTSCTLYWDLVVGSNYVYAASRNGGAVTAVDLSSGVRQWRSSANGDAQALTLASEGLLYVGGHFTAINGVPRTIAAALDPATGNVDPAFAPRFVTTFPGIWGMASSSHGLYIGGHFSHAGPASTTKRPYFAMFE